jgi:hypothetical protein
MKRRKTKDDAASMDIAHVRVDPSVKEIHARESAYCDLSVDEVELSEGLERIAWHINKLPALDSQVPGTAHWGNVKVWLQWSFAGDCK